MGEEPGRSPGGNRTILAATRAGRAQLKRWLATPVVHLRDLRSELLLKLVIADICGIDPTEMLGLQRDHVAEMSDAIASQLDDDATLDVVSLWRSESSQAALRFLDQVIASGSIRARSAGTDRPRTSQGKRTGTVRGPRTLTTGPGDLAVGVEVERGGCGR